MANSRENPPLTEIQEKRLLELDEKANAGNITEKQGIELTALIQKRRQSKDVVLSDTCIQYLLEAYAWETEKMCSITKEMDVEYFERGRKTEPESIRLLAEVDKTAYYKNETRFENEFLSGIPDVLGIEKVYKGHGDYDEYCSSIKDIKSCNDYPTFLYKIHKGLEDSHIFQLKGYGDILECEDLAVAFTLPTMPSEMREGYRMKLAYKMNAAIDQDEEFEKAWENLERSMIFDSIPVQRRVLKVKIAPFTDKERQSVYDRVKNCREWLFSFDERFKKLNS